MDEERKKEIAIKIFFYFFVFVFSSILISDVISPKEPLPQPKISNFYGVREGNSIKLCFFFENVIGGVVNSEMELLTVVESKIKHSRFVRFQWFPKKYSLIFKYFDGDISRGKAEFMIYAPRLDRGDRISFSIRLTDQFERASNKIMYTMS